VDFSLPRIRPVIETFKPILRAIRCIAGRIVGRQAEMMPADISIAVHPTTGASVYVGSDALYENSTVKRYTEAKITLHTVSVYFSIYIAMILTRSQDQRQE